MVAQKREYSDKLYCSSETKKLILTDCKTLILEETIKNKLPGLSLSQGAILGYVVKDWLEMKRDEFR